MEKVTIKHLSILKRKYGIHILGLDPVSSLKGKIIAFSKLLSLKMSNKVTVIIAIY